MTSRWSENKHPRGSGGKFKAVPKVTKLEARNVGKKAKQLFGDASIQRERRELAERLSPRQRKRLYTAILSKPAPETKSKTVPEPKPVTDTKSKKEVADKKKRLPTPRNVVSESSLTVTDKKVSLWDKSPDLRKPSGGFKVTKEKNYEYSVDTDEGKLVLNNHKTRIAFCGEVVNGLPNLNSDKVKYDNIRLIRELVRHASYVEDNTNDPPAPDWKRSYGSPDKKYIAANGLGKMQIHHVNQWVRTPFEQINKRVERGEITVEQAKAEMAKNLRKLETITKSGKAKVSYEIDVLPQGSRKLVVLAGGAHDATSPLYFNSHPKGYHPESGNFERFGIPKTGDRSRDEFNKWRGNFWREVYKRESKILAGEVTKRLRRGEISKDEVNAIFNQERQKMIEFKDYMIELRKTRGESDE